MGTQLPSAKKGTQPQFSAHICCSQTAEWIKTPIGTNVGLGPGRIVLHEDPAPLRKGAQPRNFRPMFVVAKRSPISAIAEHLFDIVIGGVWSGTLRSQGSHPLCPFHPSFPSLRSPSFTPPFSSPPSFPIPLFPVHVLTPFQKAPVNGSVRKQTDFKISEQRIGVNYNCCNCSHFASIA